MSWVVVCEDGVSRHRDPFPTRAAAVEWAHWGHCCTTVHRFSQMDPTWPSPQGPPWAPNAAAAADLLRQRGRLQVRAQGNAALGHVDPWTADRLCAAGVAVRERDGEGEWLRQVAVPAREAS